MVRWRMPEAKRDRDGIFRAPDECSARPPEPSRDELELELVLDVFDRSHWEHVADHAPFRRRARHRERQRAR